MVALRVMLFSRAKQINDKLNTVTKKLCTRKEALDFTKILSKEKLNLIKSFNEQ